MYKEIQARYHNDPTFHALVQVMYDAIDRLMLTPEEVRESAMFACVLHEQTHIRPVFVPRLSMEYINKKYGKLSSEATKHINDCGC